MAFNQGVYDFVVAYLNDPQTIINQMVRLNVNVEQLADAIGMPTSQVINYFNNAGLQAPGMGYQEPGAPEEPLYEAPAEPVVQAPEPPPQSAGPTEAEVRAQIIRDAITSVYNDPNLTPYEKARRINQAASANNVNRQEISSATGIDLDTINAYLDQAAPVTQAPPATSVSTAVEGEVGQKPREGLAPSKDFAESTAIALLPGLGDGLFDSQGNRHTSTFVKTYKVVDGQTVETPFTPQDVGSNDFVFYIGSKTGGENRERAAQSYRLQDGKLIALGEPAYYKGAQDIGFFEGMLREGLPFIASVIPGLNVAIGAALGATSTVMAQALGNAVMNAALSVAAGAKPADALKNAAVSFGVSQLIPNLTGNQFIDNAIKAGATAQLTGGKVGDAIANSLIQTGAQAATQGLSITGDRVIDSGLVSAATSALQSKVTGADTGFSALQGFVNGANAALAQKPVTEIPGTSTTIGGGTATETPSTTTTTTTAGGDTAGFEVGIPTVPTGGLSVGVATPETSVVQTGGGTQLQQIATQSEAQQKNFQYPLADYYEQPNGTIWVVDRTTGKLTQYQPSEGQATQVIGGALARAGASMGEELELPADARYKGSLKTFDPVTAAEGPSSSNLSTMALVGELDPNAPSFNLKITKNPDGTTTQTDRVGNVVTFDATGNILQDKTTYTAGTQATQAVGTVGGLFQEALGEYYKAQAAGVQGATGNVPSDVRNLSADIEKSGQLLQSGAYRASEKDYLQRNVDAFKTYEQTGDKLQLVRDIGSNLSDNFGAALGIFGKERVQELTELAQYGLSLNLPVRAVVGAIEGTKGAFESFGIKFDEVYQNLINRGVPPDQAMQQARMSGGVDGLITLVTEFLTNVTPGGGTVAGRVAKETAGEAVETFLQAKAAGESNATAFGQALTAALAAGKVTATMEGEQKVLPRIDPTVAADTGPTNLGQLVVTGKAVTGIVVSQEGNNSLVVTEDGGASVVPSVDTTTGQRINVGQSVVMDSSGGVTATPESVTTATPSGDTGVVVAVDANNNQASVIDDTGALTIVPADGLTLGQTTVLPAAPVVTAPTVPVSTTPVVTEAAPPVATEPTVTDGVVLQNNGDGTSLVLTQDGGATNVPSVDASTGLALSPGTAVTVDTSNNTATAAGTDTSTATGAETTTGADTSTTTATDTATGADTATDTGAVTDTATGVDTQTGTQTGVDTTTQTQTQPETVTQTQPETVTQVTPEPLPQINTEEPEPTQPEDLITNVPEPEPTPEDQLLQQIIKELEQPTVPETPEPPPIEPPPFEPPESIVETPPVSVEQRLTVSPRTVRPTVMPGSRVEETAQILPLRPGLSEGGTGGIEGTPEEEQQPVWNVRSLKLRRLLGI